MIVLALSTSMDQADVAPTRLERAKQKIRDLLGVRAGARSGLIAYAGTAHLVMPLTDDRSVIEPFLAAPRDRPDAGRRKERHISGSAARNCVASETADVTFFPSPGIRPVASAARNGSMTDLSSVKGITRWAVPA